MRLRYRVLMPCWPCRERPETPRPKYRRQPAKLGWIPRGSEGQPGRQWGMMCCEAVGGRAQLVDHTAGEVPLASSECRSLFWRRGLCGRGLGGH